MLLTILFVGKYLDSVGGNMHCGMNRTMKHILTVFAKTQVAIGVKRNTMREGMLLDVKTLIVV